MSQEQWSEVDDYLTSLLHDPDASLDRANEAALAARLPPIQVSAPLGKLLHLMAKMIGARRILEVGTLGGYSATWLGRALPPEGKLLTLEIDPTHAEVARKNIDAAGVGNSVEVRLGRAIDTLAALATEGVEPFDFVFIDADKPSNADYFAWALDHTHAGSVIVVDNTVQAGTVADPSATDDQTLGVRRLFDLIRDEPRVTATTIQTVGTKGYDGFTVALVL